jgi:hypothetical protein
MLPIQIMAIWRRLNLPGSTLAQDLADAAEAARDPRKTLRNCPWNHCGDSRYFRARHVAWRVAFRLQRERGEVPFIAYIERRAA